MLTQLVKDYPEVADQLLNQSMEAPEGVVSQGEINTRLHPDGTRTLNFTGILNAFAERHGARFWTHYEIDETGETPIYVTTKNGGMKILGFHTSTIETTSEEVEAQYESIDGATIRNELDDRADS